MDWLSCLSQVEVTPAASIQCARITHMHIPENPTCIHLDNQRWEEKRREFEARRILSPQSVDGMLEHPDTRASLHVTGCVDSDVGLALDPKSVERDLLEEAASGGPDRLSLAKAIIEAHDVALEQYARQRLVPWDTILTQS